MTETKPTNGFRYIEVAQKKRSRFSRNHVIDAATKPTSTGETDLYYSYMLFDEEFVRYVDEKGSVSGFPGPALPMSAVVDFDAEQDEGRIVSDEALEQARQDALSYIHDAAEGFGFTPEYFRVCFSGAKGFSLDLPRGAFGGFVPSSSAHKEVGYLVRALYPGPEPPSTLDFKIYDTNTRLWRVNNSINSKTGLYKTPLTLEELEGSSIVEIKELAAKPRKVERPKVEPVEKLVELYERARTETSSGPKPSGASRNGARGNDAKKAAALYEAGERNTCLTSDAGWLRRKGHDEQTILTVLEALNATACEEPLDEGELRGIARSVARYDPQGVPPLDAESEWGDPEPLPTLPPVPPSISICYRMLSAIGSRM